jgi:hypothetical protein
MEYDIAKTLIETSVGNIINKIVNSNFTDIEKINGEVRLIIDMEIVLSEIKNNTMTIIDFIIDRFKIIDRDELIKTFITHLFSVQTKNCILQISKFLPGSYFKDSKNPNDLLKIAHKYLAQKIIDCIFNPYMIDTLIELSDASSNQFLKFMIKNWKTLLASVLTLIIILIFYKKSHKLSD